jgi:hypothetical protein
VAEKKKLAAMIKPAKPISEMTEGKLEALAAQIVRAAKADRKPTRD